MTLQNLLEQAKQGNAKAIAILFNHSLRTKGITVKAGTKESCLLIVLQSETTPSQQVSVTDIQKLIAKLGALSGINKVKVCGCQLGNKNIVWQQEFGLNVPSPEPIETSPEPIETVESQQPKGIGIKEKARHGDLEAITSLLNLALKNQKVTTKIALDNAALLVRLKADKLPSKEDLTRIIQREITSLKPEVIALVKIAGYEANNDFPTWLSEFKIAGNIQQNSEIGKLKANPFFQGASQQLEKLNIKVTDEQINQALQYKEKITAQSLQYKEKIAAQYKEQIKSPKVNQFVELAKQHKIKIVAAVCLLILGKVALGFLFPPQPQLTQQRPSGMSPEEALEYQRNQATMTKEQLEALQRARQTNAETSQRALEAGTQIGNEVNTNQNYYGSLIGQYNQPLGLISTNKNDIESICNPNGRFGKHNSYSIWNHFGIYGNSSSDSSAYNPNANNPPKIAEIGRPVSKNKQKFPNAIDPDEIAQLCIANN